MSYTPGPWHRNIKAKGKYPVIYAGRNTHVAQAIGHNALDGEEIESNISLIAAAPELLEALESAITTANRLDSYGNDAWACLSDITDLQSIVDKAKGIGI